MATVGVRGPAASGQQAMGIYGWNAQGQPLDQNGNLWIGNLGTPGVPEGYDGAPIAQGGTIPAYSPLPPGYTPPPGTAMPLPPGSKTPVFGTATTQNAGGGGNPWASTPDFLRPGGIGNAQPNQIPPDYTTPTIPNGPNVTPTGADAGNPWGSTPTFLRPGGIGYSNPQTPPDYTIPQGGSSSTGGRTPLAGAGGNWQPIGRGGNPQPVPGASPRNTNVPWGGGSWQPININTPYPGLGGPGTSAPTTPNPFTTPGYNIPTNTPSGPNSTFPTWSATPGGSGGGYQGGDPGYMASAEANRAADYGNLYENQYGNQYQQALGQENAYQNQANSAYNDLWTTPGFTAQESAAIQANPNAPMGAVDQTRAAMAAAIDPSKLGLSDQYVQELKNQAGQQIGLQYGAALDQLNREAAASGNVNPLALAAARDRLLRSQAIDSANAVTNADIAATGAQRAANTNIANMQLGAATTVGGMGLQAGEYGDTAASQRAAQIASQRIQGQQAARNYWQSQGQFQGGQANQATQARLAGAQTSLSGMGQGGQIAMGTEAERRAYAPKVNATLPLGSRGHVTIGGNVPGTVGV